MAACTLTACAQTKEKQSMKKQKVLVAYFSATGTTEAIARRIASVANGELYEIRPEQPYTTADLDWTDRQSRSSVEMHDPQSRPAIDGKKVDVAGYDVIFVGFPIWWDLAPTVVNTFIESHDLKGKTVIPFATSGGSGIGNSEKELRKAYPEISWRGGKLLNGASEKTIGEWLGEIM